MCKVTLTVAGGAHKPVRNWQQFPNLRRRPPRPAAGRGRLQVAVRRVFIASDGEPVPSSVFYDWCRGSGQRRLSQLCRHSIWRILVKVAVPIGRARLPGNPVLWKLKEQPPNA